MIREILTKTTQTTKLKIVGSEIDQVRNQDEAESAVRLYNGQHIGIASAVGTVDVERLTNQARETLHFGLPYPVQPEGKRSLTTERTGQWRSLTELVEYTQAILGPLKERHPNYLFDGYTEQRRMQFQVSNDAGLDLSYGSMLTETTFFIKEKGSGNMFDTITGVEGEQVSPEEVIAECSRLLTADAYKIAQCPEGTHRVLVPVLFAPFVNLFRTDLSARSYREGTSVFAAAYREGKALFHPDVHLVDSRDSSAIRVQPFDGEGVVRDAPNLDFVKDGSVQNFYANKRDAVLYDLAPTGSAGGDLAGAPSSTSGTLRFMPTKERLVDLLDGQPALLLQVTAGGDVTRKGDIAMPAQAAYRIEADGSLSGRYPQFSLTGNLYEVLGKGFIGVSAEPSSPHSDSTYFATAMRVQPHK